MFDAKQLRTLKYRLEDAVAETLDELGASRPGAKGTTIVNTELDDLISYLTQSVHSEVISMLEDESDDTEEEEGV